MTEIIRDKLQVDINPKKLSSLKLQAGDDAVQLLSDIWSTEAGDLPHYLAVFYDKNVKQLSDNDSFITLSFSNHGYIIEANENIDIAEARKQIEIDLEIINRESQWGEEGSIYFDQWWPAPVVDKTKDTMEFGVSLKDFHNKAFNRTINRIILTRHGHLALNYSLSEKDIADNQPFSYFQKKLDEVTAAMTIGEGYRYQDVNEDIDMPSRSRMINLLLSSEIF